MNRWAMHNPEAHIERAQLDTLEERLAERDARFDGDRERDEIDRRYEEQDDYYRERES